MPAAAHPMDVLAVQVLQSAGEVGITPAGQQLPHCMYITCGSAEQTGPHVLNKACGQEHALSGT